MSITLFTALSSRYSKSRSSNTLMLGARVQYQCAKRGDFPAVFGKLFGKKDPTPMSSLVFQGWCVVDDFVVDVVVVVNYNNNPYADLK